MMGIAFMIAMALSFDGLGVGMAYGLKRIRIPLSPRVIIGMVSGLVMGISMLMGHLLVPYIGFMQPEIIGGIILILVGSYQLFLVLKDRRSEPQAFPVMTTFTHASDPYQTILSINLNIFGLVIKVLKSPDYADLDGSGSINPKEGVLLGLALSLDSFASGIAAAIASVPYYVIILVAVLQTLMIGTGQVLTKKMSSSQLNTLKYLPGWLLILIGFIKIF